ncbi:nicotinate phosphoribosyltransferase [soil metagenome]
MTAWTGPPSSGDRSSTALLTDHYELTGLDAALRSGVAHHRATFEVFGRHLPPGRRYGVVAGLARAIDAVTRFRFAEPELAYLRERGFLSAEALDWLAGYRFSGDVTGYHDGELYFPYSPILTVDATFGEGLILETILLSVLNHDAAIASAAARMVHAAAGRTTIEGGGRRTHEEAGVAAALAAVMAGFDVTSNLEAGRRFGVPTAGTTMHAFTLAHASEADAFRAQVAAFGPDTTFLVDTYDIATGIAGAFAAAGPEMGAIRIDSGDLGHEARKARIQLDSLGASACQIVVSGDLDEFAMAELAAAPVDRYLLGTRLVTGSGAPTAELVYKLVAIADAPGDDAPQRPVAKTSAGKGHRGGRKVATRVLDAEGFAVAERVVGPTDHPDPVADHHVERGLQVPWLQAGEPVRPFSVDAARAHHRSALAELRPEHLELAPGHAAFTGLQPS